MEKGNIRLAIKEATRACRRESSRVNIRGSTRNRSAATRRSITCRFKCPGDRDSRDRDNKANPKDNPKDSLKDSRKDSLNPRGSLKANPRDNRDSLKANPRDRHIVHRKEVTYGTIGRLIFRR